MADKVIKSNYQSQLIRTVDRITNRLKTKVKILPVIKKIYPTGWTDAHIEQLMRLKNLVRSAYELQKLRIASGNRLVMNFYTKMGLKPGDPKTKIDSLGGKLITILFKEYKLLSDGMVDWSTCNSAPKLKKMLIENKLKNGQITDETEWELADIYFMLLKKEKESFAMITRYLDDNAKIFKIWPILRDEFGGIGGAIAATIIAKFHIGDWMLEQTNEIIENRISKWWAFAGLDVVTTLDSKGDVIKATARNMTTDHLCARRYKAKDGSIKEKVSVTYDPELKTKLLGIMGGSILKASAIQGKKSPNCLSVYYANIYYQEKIRQEGRRETMITMIMNRQGNPDKKEATKLAMKELSKDRIHKMANRKMVKLVIQDVFLRWRAIEGYPASLPYDQAILGKKHSHVSAA